MNDSCLQENRSFYQLGKQLVTQKQQRKLNNFYMAQRELSLALLEAKPLGICRIITSTNLATGAINIYTEGSRGTL